MALALIESSHCNMDRQTISFGLGFVVRAINKLKQMFFGRRAARRRGPTLSGDSIVKATRDTAAARLLGPRKTRKVN